MIRLSSLDKQSKNDNKGIICFEAYILGLIHSHSIKDPEDWAFATNSIAGKDWEQDVGLMTQYFEKKFKQIK